MIEIPIQMKEIENNEISEVMSFHNLSYRDKRTVKDWIWEYKGNYPNLFVFTVIKDGDKVVGTQGMIPVYLNIKGETHLSGKSENSLLDPKYRGGERFKELYDFAMALCKERKMRCVWGFTSAVKVWRNKLGFSVYEDAMYASMLILKPRQFITQIRKSKQDVVRKTAKSLAVMLLSLYSATRGFTFRCLKRTSRDFSIEQRLRSSSDISELYKRLREKYAELIHIEMDEKYIAWRIFDNPNVEYATFFAYEDILLKAYCFVALSKSGEAYLSDLTFEDYEAGSFLLKKILHQFRRRKVTSAHFMGNIRNPLIATIFGLLKNSGFIKRDSTPFVLKNIFCEDEKFLSNIRNWYINGLWTEGFQF
jgi:hypothetical protein